MQAFPIGWLCCWCLVSLFGPAEISGIQVREPDQEASSQSSPPQDSSSKADALTATESTDRGVAVVAVGEAPDTQPIASQFVPSPQDLSNLENDIFLPNTTPTIDAVFPENHKNYSDSIAALELPPFMQEYNKYQQQYKEYYQQKHQYAASAKPFRFEDAVSATKNHLTTEGLSAFGDINSAKSHSDSRPRHVQFPYPYQSSEHISQTAVEPAPPTAYPIPEHLLHGALKPSKLPQSHSFPSFSDLASPFMDLFGSPKVSTLRPTAVESHRSQAAHKHKSEPPPWKRLVKVLSTIVPFGLFLATLTPNLIYINSTNADNRSSSRLRAQDNAASRQSRHDLSMDPLMKLVERFGGVEAMEDPQCEDRFFCEMSVLGDQENSNFIEKGFWYLASETPDHISEEVGMKELFKAIKQKSCSIFNCPEKIPREMKADISDVAESKKNLQSEIVLNAANSKPEKKIKKVKKFRS